MEGTLGGLSAPLFLNGQNTPKKSSQIKKLFFNV